MGGVNFCGRVSAGNANHLAFLRGVAKVVPEVAFRDDPPKARLVLVSAISPTPVQGSTNGAGAAARERGRASWASA